MELKVWVDGIQKEVCGVTYSTTTQDVVLALACALGQTGRFSLVEKWRDSKRPLTPAECPLQSRHKWGEYAGEVAYYLVQAGMDTAGHLATGHQKENVLPSNTQLFRHNFKPPDTFCHKLNSPELLKRSFTFSCAHQPHYGQMAMSLSKSLTALPQQRHTQNLVTSTISSSVAQELHPGMNAVSQRKLGGSSHNSVISSCVQSACSSVKNVSESFSSIDTPQKTTVTSPTVSTRGIGKHHVASVPLYSGQNKDSFSSLARKHNSTHQLKMMSADHSKQQTVHSNLRKVHQQHVMESSHPLLSQNGHPTSAVEKQQQQMNLSQELPHAVVTKLNQHPRPLPSPRHISVSAPSLVQDSSSVHVRLKDDQKPRQQKENLHGDHLQMISDSSKSHCNDKNEDTCVNATGTKVSSNHNIQNGQGNMTLKSNPSSILRIAREYLQKNGSIQKIGHSNENMQSSVELKNTSESCSDFKADMIKYASLDRHTVKCKPHPTLPNRSLSVGHGDEGQKLDKRHPGRIQPGFNDDCLQPSTEEKKLLMVKQDNSSNIKKMSSFASAVAHLRLLTESVDKNKANIAHVHQHSEDSVLKSDKLVSHARQYSSGSQADHSLKEILSSSSNKQMVKVQPFIGTSKNHLNYTNSSQEQSSNKTSMSVNSTSSMQHHSAFTNDFTQSNSKESYIPQSHKSASSGKHSKDIQPDRNRTEAEADTNNNNSSNKSGSSNSYQESAYYEPKKLECEKYISDQKFPGVLTRDISTCNRTNSNDSHKWSVEVAASPNQAKEEYIQLLRTLEMQQEKIKQQEVQINEVTSEITSLEEREAQIREKLQAIVKEIYNFEIQETVSKEELDKLDKTEWMSVLQREQEIEADINLQIASLKSNLEQLESKVRQLKNDEDRKYTEIHLEEEKEAQERQQNEELERKITSEKEELKKQLDNVNEVITEKEKQLKNLEEEMAETGTALNQKEEQMKIIEEELKSETNLIHSQIKVHSMLPHIQASDSDEAILKVLEGQMTAQSSSATPAEIDNFNGITSAQHLYTLAGTVWV